MGSPTSFSNNFYGHLPGVSGLNFQRNNPLANAAFQSTNNSLNFHMGLQAASRTQNVSPNSNQMNLQLNLNQLKQRASSQLPSTLLNSSNNTLINIGQFPKQYNDQQANSSSLDWSQFPSLSRNPSQNQTLPTKNYVNMVSKQEAASEFQIQQEDFPALPGAQIGFKADFKEEYPALSGAQNAATPSFLDGQNKPTSSAMSFDGLSTSLKDGMNSQSLAKTSTSVANSNAHRRGIQTQPDGTMTNVPSGMVSDQFGVVGLLTFMRAVDTDPNIVALAPGIDLTTLGLSLNQSEPLYTSFQSPWAELPCRPQDIDSSVPSEYLTSPFIRDKLAPFRFNRYQDDLLFYIFYVYGGDLLQLAAAAELYNREWRYHKEERIWMTRAPGVEAIAKTAVYERGTYFFFDVQSWRKVPKEFHLEYSKLEDRPQLPDSVQASLGATGLNPKTA